MYGQVFSDLNESLKKFKAHETATGISLQFFETLIWQTGLLVGFRSELVSMYALIASEYVLTRRLGTERWRPHEEAHSTPSSLRTYLLSRIKYR